MLVDSLKINAMGQRVLILKQKSGSLFLAIWIAAAEADAIAIRMQKVEIPRPLTHDLFCNTVEKFGATVEKIIIKSSVENGDIFFKNISTNWNDSVLIQINNTQLLSEDNKVNLTSLLGYFASTKFVNTSPTKAELFSVSCEIAESSK